MTIETLTARADVRRPQSFLTVWHEPDRPDVQPSERRYITSIQIRDGADIDGPVNRVCDTWPAPAGWRFWFERSGEVVA